MWLEDLVLLKAQVCSIDLIWLLDLEWQKDLGQLKDKAWLKGLVF